MIYLFNCYNKIQGIIFLKIGNIKESMIFPAWNVYVAVIKGFLYRLGAFPLSEEKGLLNDELKRYNFSEQSVTIEQLNALAADTLSGFSKKLVHLKEYAIYFYKHFRIPVSITSPTVMYDYYILKATGSKR